MMKKGLISFSHSNHHIQRFLLANVSATRKKKYTLNILKDALNDSVCNAIVRTKRLYFFG